MNFFLSFGKTIVLLFKLISVQERSQHSLTLVANTIKNVPENAPWLFLVEAQKNRKTGLRVEPDVLIRAGAALYGR